MELQESRERLFKHLSWEIRDARVVDAMKRVPREHFVPQELRDAAYEDHPLSIGFGQTISQPFIVAVMLQALELKETDTVLEVGTGSGYVAAILGELAAKVVSVEIVPELADSARATVQALGYSNVHIHLVPKTTLGWIPD
ncbi:MAG: protein-L-isoaspartate O-methyltransferase, partial [Dehalococcoidia bacterium]|nr:protein-L-isoaspartate O-methyltransferase [Dehalococcoidia bacterium]